MIKKIFCYQNQIRQCTALIYFNVTIYFRFSSRENTALRSISRSRKKGRRKKGNIKGHKTKRMKILQRRLTIVNFAPLLFPIEAWTTDGPTVHRPSSIVSNRPPSGQEARDNKYRENEKLLKTSFLALVILVAPRDAALKTCHHPRRPLSTSAAFSTLVHPDSRRFLRGWVSGHANYLYVKVL